MINQESVETVYSPSMPNRNRTPRRFGRPSSRIAIASWVLAALFAHAPEVRADAKADARRHFDAGVSLLKAEDYEGAALSFEASLKLYPTKTALFNLANCHKALKRYDEALVALFRLRRDFAGRLDAEMLAETAAIEKEIRNLVGTLAIEVDRPGAAVLVDGREAGTSPLAKPVLLSPGNHEVTARLSGAVFVVEKVLLLSGDEKRVRLKAVAPGADEGGFIPSTESTPSTDSTPDSHPSGRRPSALFWGAAGGAVATGVLAGVFFGLRGKAQGAYDDTVEDWEALSPEQQASSAGGALLGDMRDAAGDYDKFNGAGVGMAVAAGALTAAAVIILVVDLKGGAEEPAEKTARVRFRPGFGGVGIDF
jgi:hypothetical protein